MGQLYVWLPIFWVSRLFSLALLGVAIKVIGNPNGFLMMILIGIPISLGYIPAYRAVFSGDRYLKYFKQFEKEDEAWHKKWNRRTIAFVWAQSLLRYWVLLPHLPLLSCSANGKEKLRK